MEKFIWKDEALKRMPPMWECKPYASGLIKAVGDAFQATEDLLWQLLTERDVHSAIGQQLDDIGDILGESRKGRNDIIYRTVLLVVASLKSASGTRSDIVSIAKVVTGAEIAKVFDHVPNTTYVYVNVPVTSVEAESIEKAHMSHVGTRVIWSFGDEYVKSVPEESQGSGGNQFGDPLTQFGDPNSGFGAANSSELRVFSLDRPLGFTSLVPGATRYEVIEDNFGYLCNISSSEEMELRTGLLINHEGDYVLDQDGNRIRYITTR